MSPPNDVRSPRAAAGSPPVSFAEEGCHWPSRRLVRVPGLSESILLSEFTQIHSPPLSRSSSSPQFLEDTRNSTEDCTKIHQRIRSAESSTLTSQEKLSS
ncbi:hypothetical protein RvY_13561 [Ramazzottius varieornatus]|uniref:Uncharacterized protein n=1 Tax=Ramazzottius varieornatus TaxID=947166 RepID=A0A1D1VWT4_RAMVA|nr:hypothetical protein RvY_13561 [Ramazzottius varieornatus]